jgi:hypothetical protein
MCAAALGVSMWEGRGGEVYCWWPGRLGWKGNGVLEGCAEARALDRAVFAGSFGRHGWNCVHWKGISQRLC